MFQFLLVVLTKTTFYDISIDFPPGFLCNCNAGNYRTRVFEILHLTICAGEGPGARQGAGPGERQGAGPGAGQGERQGAGSGAGDGKILHWRCQCYLLIPTLI